MTVLARTSINLSDQPTVNMVSFHALYSIKNSGKHQAKGTKLVHMDFKFERYGGGGGEETWIDLIRNGRANI
jgi:hypothetical protein